MGSNVLSFGGERDMQQQPQQQKMSGRLVQEVLRVLGVGAAIVLLVAAITALVFFLSGQTTGLHVLANLVGIALLVAFGVTLATLGQAIREGLSYRHVQARIQARAARLHPIEEKLVQLSATSPDMALVLQILQEREAEQQAESERRVFWQGVAQNFVFYLLGVVIPILLLGLHAGG